MRVNAGTGIVDAYRYGGNIPFLDVADTRFVPDIVRLFAQLQKPEGGVCSSTPLWGDPNYRRELFETVKKGVESGLTFDTYAFLLGDEMSMLNGRVGNRSHIRGPRGGFQGLSQATIWKHRGPEPTMGHKP